MTPAAKSHRIDSNGMSRTLPPPLHQQRALSARAPGAGSFLGEDVLDAEDETVRRERTAIATINSELAFLSCDDVKELSHEFPLLKRQLEDFSTRRNRRQNAKLQVRMQHALCTRPRARPIAPGLANGRQTTQWLTPACR